jgi:hypothetical protein
MRVCDWNHSEGLGGIWGQRAACNVLLSGGTQKKREGRLLGMTVKLHRYHHDFAFPLYVQAHLYLHVLLWLAEATAKESRS